MQELNDYYRGRLKWLAGVVVAGALIYHAIVRSYSVQAGANPFAASVLHWSESVLVGLAFLLGEWFIRTRLWKLEKPALDFEGDWNAVTKYAYVEKGTDAVQEGAVDYSAKHDVTIVQDCTAIKIAPTEGAYTNWYSIAMNLIPPDKMGYVYHVNYKDGDARFPREAKGYEEMTVVKRKKEWWRRGRPLKLTGVFSHCAEGGGPLYSGTVVFERRS